jgi:penicillin-binding protein 2
MYNLSPAMKWKLTLLVLISLLAAACSSQELPLSQNTGESSASASTAVQAGDSAPASEETNTGDAGGYARAFYRAWEAQDFIGMYSLLAPQSQALVDSQSFVQRYDEALKTAAVQTVSAQPVSLVQDGNEAQFGVRVTWETAVFGPITRDYTVPMVFDNGRWGIVWSEGLILPELEGGNRLAIEYIVPSRAGIYDIGGYALAFQGKAIGLGIIPGQIVDEASLLATLSPILGKTPEEIKALYASAQPDWYVAVGDIPEDVLQENILALQPYINAGLAPPEARNSRIYSDSGIAPHIVGYTGFIPAEEIDSYLEQGYRGDEMVGRTGIEAWGEDYLNGDRGGKLSVVGSNGEFVTTLIEKAPLQSRSIYSTIEHTFQAAVEQALAEAVESHPLGHAGAIVVLDVNNGDVKAMASYPTYDPAIFDALRPGSDTALTNVLNNPGRPLVNRAAQGVYPAGSVFKIISMAAALNSGQYTPETVYTSTGIWTRLGDEYAKTDWRTGGHGTISLKQALIVSCNTCFYDVGYNLDGQDNTLLSDTAVEFGLGAKTGLVGTAESPGLIPNPEWKMANYGEGWAAGDAVNMAIGQGFVQVTPLQIASILAAIANGGTLYQPKLIDRLGAGGGAPEEAWPVAEIGQIPLSAEQIGVYKDSLWNVANGPWGTATDRFEGLPIQVAGKTGTAEAPPNDSHAWFTGYAPAAPYTKADGTLIEQPEIAISVIMENAGEGSAVAAPIFRRIVELYYGIEPLTPYPWSTGST